MSNPGDSFTLRLARPEEHDELEDCSGELRSSFRNIATS